MENGVKNYFLAPSWDYVPDAKPNVTIALWNVVSSPTKMVPPLAAATASPDDEDIGKSTKKGFEWIRESEKEKKKVGVWTTFINHLSSLRLQPGKNSAASIHDLYSFDSIHTREAYPSREYIEQIVKTEPVKKYLEKFDFEKPVYLVVGTKTVSGTTIRQLLRKETSTGVELSVTNAALGRRLNSGGTLKFDGSTDFVFAFRIRKIIVNRKFEIEDESDAEGGVLGPHEQEELDIEVHGIEDYDAVDLPAGGKKVTVEEDGESVYVTII